MKKEIKQFVCVVLILLIPNLLNENTSSQNTWSGGPGVTGPVLFNWTNTFSSQSNISWMGIPGGLLLALTAIAHDVTGYMGSLHTGFAVDMDGDGDKDILSDSGYRALIAWFENNGTGGGWTRHDVSSTGEIYSPRACYPIDMDGDGDIDVIGSERSSIYKRIYLWFNADGTGTEWNTQIIADDLNSPWSICAADVDGDGDNDIVAGDFGSDAQIIWYENQSFSGPWPAHTVASVIACYDLHTADIDQDGDIDIISANWWTNNELNLWENVDGTGDSWTRYKIRNTIDQATSVCTGDVDGDNNIDIIATGYGDDGRISWFENPDSIQGTWIEHVLQNEFHGGQAVHELDFDGDGDVDILGAAGYPGLYELFLWESIDGSGDNWIRHSLDSGSWYMDVDVADIDGDDTLDVISFSSVGSIIDWYRLEYADSGHLVSSILDVLQYPNWQQIQWEDSAPPGCNLKFQVKSSNDSNDMGEWSDYIEEPGSLTGYIDSTHRYIQYMVSMEGSGQRFVTPMLDSVTFFWEWLGIEEENGSGETRLFPVFPNPASGSSVIKFRLAEMGSVTISVYDLAGRLRAVPVDSEMNSGIHEVEVSGLPSGSYYVRMVAGDDTLQCQFTLTGE
ncbi:MAG: T9SS type A sorting domain-containing protein [Candidatus Aegiribacteria sp.]|nr:T9SS type A sorting domain-containing protein [Candidatus Aegiribacteria sp.]